MNQLSVTDGNIVDLERKYYLNELSLSEGQIKDLERAWLDSLGYTDVLNVEDAWKRHLADTGYDTQRRDAERDFYEDNV